MNILKFVQSIVEQGGRKLSADEKEYYKHATGFGLCCNDKFNEFERGNDLGGLGFSFMDNIYVAFHLNLVHGIRYTMEEEMHNWLTKEPTVYTCCLKGASVYTNYMLVKEKYLDFIRLGKKYLDKDLPDTPKARLDRLVTRGLDRRFDGRAKKLFARRKKEADAIVKDFARSFYEKYPYMLEYDRAWSKYDRSERYHLMMRDTFLLKRTGLSFSDSEKYIIKMYGSLDT